MLGRELVYAYLTGVGFLVVAYPMQGQCEGLESRVSNKVGSSRLFCFKLCLSLEFGEIALLYNGKKIYSA